MAWRRECALQVVDELQSRGRAILGGDVYLKIDGQGYRAMGDNWYTNRDFTTDYATFCMNSCAASRAYILRYPEKAGETYAYSIVPDLGGSLGVGV